MAGGGGKERGIPHRRKEFHKKKQHDGTHGGKKRPHREAICRFSKDVPRALGDRRGTERST